MLKYEILELLLTLLLPRKDVKPLAKELLSRYNTITGVLSQPVGTLCKIPGLGMTSAINLKVIFECIPYCLSEQMPNQDLLENPDNIANFARMKIGILRREGYMVILLDGRNHLISWKLISEGEVNMIYHSPRNIVEFAINLQASKVVLVHNHPSGLCTPTEDDIKATADLYAALSTVNVELADHLVVTAWEYFSFAAHKMLHTVRSNTYDQ